MGQQITMELLLILCTLLLNDEAYSDYVVQQSPNSYLWGNSELMCSAKGRNSTFAVPDVDLLTMTVKDKISLTEEAWVGYFQSYEYFRVLVCVPLNVIESLVPAPSTIREKHGPGLCYSICGLQGLIGLQTGRCYCITASNFSIPEIQITNSSCKDPVACSNGMLCGYKGNNTIAVYEKVSVSANNINGNDSGCILVTKEKALRMYVRQCATSFKHLCEHSTAHIRHLEVSPKQDQWVHTVTDCAETGKRPTSYIGDEAQFEFPNISGSWWITVVRDLVIQKSGTLKGTPVYEGFLRNNTGGINLEFVSAREASKRKSVVCLSDKMEIATSYQTTRARMTTSSDPPKLNDTSHTTGPTISDHWNQTNKLATTTLTSSTSEASTTTQIPAKAEASRTIPKIKDCAFPVVVVAGSVSGAFIAGICVCVVILFLLLKGRRCIRIGDTYENIAMEGINLNREHDYAILNPALTVSSS